MTTKPQLFFLHFAGGNSYSFQFILPHLIDFEVIQLELPGRGRRVNEKLLNEYQEAAEDVYQQILLKQTSPIFLIYGHSLGAYLTLRVARMLEKVGRAPAYILVSGNPGPGIRENKKRYLFEHKDFVKELRSLGGVPEEVFLNKELFDFFEPILRADFELAEKNDMPEETAVDIPMYALMGTEEEDRDKISNWNRFTNSSFRSELLEGDHFFIFKHPQRIATLIKQCYMEVDRLTSNNQEQLQ